MEIFLSYLLVFLLGFLLGVIGLVIRRPKSGPDEKKKGESAKEQPLLIRTELQTKQRHLQEITNYFRKHDKVKNDDIEELLGVSDATATRYLDALEHMGRIQQVGSVGRQVYYEPVDLPDIPLGSD